MKKMTFTGATFQRREMSRAWEPPKLILEKIILGQRDNELQRLTIATEDTGLTQKEA